MHKAKFPRSRLSATVLTAIVAISPQISDAAPDYPKKPIRLIVPFVPGGGVDVVVRIVGQKLSEAIKTPIVVDNRGGAAGSIAAEYAAKAPPDGYTILAISTSLSVNQAIHPKVPYDLKRDYVPITQITSQPYVLAVHPSVAAHTIRELVDLAKQKPGFLNYASSGTGGLQHLAGILLSSAAAINIVHVPYQGGGAQLTDVLAGNIQLQFTLPMLTYQYVKTGRLRYLAVTALKRLKAFPGIPTIAETLPDYEVTAGYGVVAPVKTPSDIVAKLNREIGRVLLLPEVRGRFEADGMEPVGNTPEQFGLHISHEIAKWQKVALEAGVKDN